MQPDDPSQILVAKALRVADNAITRRQVPKTRAELRAAYADIERRLKKGDHCLGVFGRSILGYATFFENQYGATEEESKLLANALLELMCSEKN